MLLRGRAAAWIGFLCGFWTLSPATFGASATNAGPVIAQVLNNYSLIPAGFPNSGIAPGTLFIIKGSGLADPNAQALPLQSSTAASGLPAALNGASVTVTSGGVTTTPVFYYAIAAQLALVLPSNTPVGTATVTVTYNGEASAPFTFQVVATAMGFGAYYGTGSGLGIAVNTATGALYNYDAAILPGATILLYGSGLGADPARDSQYVSAAFSINNLAHIYVGGVDASIVYQGASGFPGVNQVNLTIPSNTPLGCYVPITGVTAAGLPTNTITIPISIDGPCSDDFGITATQRQNLSAKATVNTGSVGIGQTTNGPGSNPFNGASAVFQSYPGSTYGPYGSGAASGSVSLNGCVVLTSSSGYKPTQLDPGAVTVTEPSGATVMLTPVLPTDVGILTALLGAGSIPPTGGVFTFTGSGGSNPTGNNVGNFSATVSLPNPLPAWTNQSAAASVTRANGLLVQWSGGAASSFVFIAGTSTSLVASGTSSVKQVTGFFGCQIPASAGQFTVPGYVTSALPAGAGILPAGFGNVTVTIVTNYNTFTAPGLDYGTASGSIDYLVGSMFF